MPQNEGLVKTYYPNNLDPKKLGAIETEGNYSNGVRNGLWVFWYDGEAYNDWGEDDDPQQMMKAILMGNGTPQRL